VKLRPKARIGRGGIPLEFAVGHAFEVWADPAVPQNEDTGTARVCSAMSRYSTAWVEYLQQNGLDHRQGVRSRLKLAMYSVDYLIGEGRREYAERLLGDAQVADLPDLRGASERGWWPTASGWDTRDRQPVPRRPWLAPTPAHLSTPRVGASTTTSMSKIGRESAARWLRLRVRRINVGLSRQTVRHFVGQRVRVVRCGAHVTTSTHRRSRTCRCSRCRPCWAAHNSVGRLSSVGCAGCSSSARRMSSCGNYVPPEAGGDLRRDEQLWGARWGDGHPPV
jgi:hypothetical protein